MGQAIGGSLPLAIGVAIPVGIYFAMGNGRPTCWASSKTGWDSTTRSS